MRDLSPWHLLLIFAIIVLVFGAAKLPDLARGTGQALRIFKSETRGLKDDEEKSKGAENTVAGELDSQKAELDRRQAALDLERRQAELDAERAKLDNNV